MGPGSPSREGPQTRTGQPQVTEGGTPTSPTEARKTPAITMTKRGNAHGVSSSGDAFDKSRTLTSTSVSNSLLFKVNTHDGDHGNWLSQRTLPGAQQCLPASVGQKSPTLAQQSQAACSPAALPPAKSLGTTSRAATTPSNCQVQSSAEACTQVKPHLLGGLKQTVAVTAKATPEITCPVRKQLPSTTPGLCFLSITFLLPREYSPVAPAAAAFTPR